MSDELKEKLLSDIDETDWFPLIQHHKQSAVYITSGISLIDVAVAVAQDKIEFIKLWLDTGALRKPTEEETKIWEKEKHTKMAKFIIIQPYVLIELI